MQEVVQSSAEDDLKRKKVLTPAAAR